MTEGAAGDGGIPVARLVEALLKQVFRLVAVSWLLAWVLTKCSSYTLLNLPVTFALICLLRWLALHLDVRMRQEDLPPPPPPQKVYTRTPSRAHRHSLRRSCTHAIGWDHDAWRGMVNSKVVEFAWDRLCNSIVQEWIYDAWYSTLTADIEFPAELRLILNGCFGEVCRRARRVDLRHLLVRHVCDVVKTHLELYRRTVYESLGDSYQNIPTAAGRERALLHDLKTNPKDLHIALQTDDGHYKVLKQYSEGIVSKILPGELQIPLIQTLVREMLATCVLRPVMYYFMPYSLNKLFLSMFETGSTSAAAHSKDASEDFANRAKASAHQEKLHLEKRAAWVAERHDQRRRQRSVSMKTRVELEGKAKDHGTLSDRAATTPVRTLDEASKQALAASTAFVSAHTSAWLDLHTPPLPSPHIATTSQLDQTHAHSDSELMMEMEGLNQSEQQLDALLSAVGTPPPTSRHHRSASTGTPHTSPRPPIQPPLSPDVATPATPPTRISNPNIPSAAMDTSADRPGTSAQARILKGAGMPGTRNSAEMHVQAVGRSGFDGWPRARVVTAMPRQDPTGGNKDFVVYQIRVVDNSGEWTVDRRFRNFEALHKKLRENPKLREQVLVKLPAKNRLPFMANGHNTEFVEKRRAELDNYLHTLLSDWTVAVCEDVWEFLRQGSELYGQDVGEGGLMRTLTSNMDIATKSMKRVMGDALDEGRGRFSKLSSKVGDSATKVASAMPKSMLRLTQSPTKMRAANMSLDSTASAGLDLSLGSASFSKPLEGADAGRPDDTMSSSSAASSPTHMQAQAQMLLNAAASTDSPATAPPTAASAPAPTNSPSSSPLTRSKSKLRPNKSMGSGAGTAGRRPSPRKKESLAESASLPPREQDLDSYASLELGDSSGISAPLYDVIDTLFDMQSRGFLRRQVIVSARQLLSLVAGDYVDTFLMSHLNNLRSEHTIARLIIDLQRELWPGGLWFATTQPPPRQPAPAEDPGTSTDKSAPKRPVIESMLPEKFVDVNYRYGDEEAVAAQVKGKLLSTAPTTLVRLIGPKAYQKSTMDLYNMLQSPTFTLMIGYRILEGVIVALFPELEDRIMPYE